MTGSAEVIEIDGSQGEGGGQILRTSVALSAVTGRPVHIHSIRAKRSQPGLRPQHRASVLAAARVCNGGVTGDAVGSTELTFWPGDPDQIQGGQFRFDIETAGSANLVMQTVLPILLRAKERSQVTVTGGTHNPFAPPAPFLRFAFQNALRKIGYDVGFELVRPGFYPAGGGKLVMHVGPVLHDRLRRLDWVDRGGFISLRCEVLVSQLPEHVARRELETLRRALRHAGWPLPAVTVREAEETRSPGNSVSVRAIYDNADEIFTGFGERGKRAEAVAQQAADAAVKWLTAGVPVGEHLADQLLIPMALAHGGRFVTMPLDLHTPTNAAVISQVLGKTTRFTDHGGRVVVEVE